MSSINGLNNIPQLRFKNKYIEQNSEWIIFSFDELFTHKGGSPLEKYVLDSGTFNFISIGNYSKDGRYIDNGQRIILNSITQDKLLKKDSLVMVLNDKTSRGDIIGSTILIDENNRYIYNQRSESIMCKKNIIPKFAWFLFNNPKFREHVKSKAQGGTQIYINFKTIKDTKYKIPNLYEQKKITDFLSLLDEKVIKQELIINNLKKYKRGLIKQCFSLNEDYYPHLRFSCYNTQWTPIKLGNYLKFYSGLTYSPNDITDNSGTLVLRSSNIQNNKIENADNVYVNDKKVNVDNVEIGDIIVVVRNGSRNLIGKHAQIKTKMEKTVIGAFMTGIRSSTPNFTMALLDSDRFSEEIHKNLGATINQITTGIFKNMIFYMPNSLEEKEKIGLLFNKVDNLITWHEKKLSLLQKQKKALLQQLFI